MDRAALQGQSPRQVERVAWTEPRGGEAAPGGVYTTNSSGSWSFWSRLGDREFTDPLGPESSARPRARLRGAGRGAGSGRVWPRLRLCWSACPAAALASRTCRQRPRGCPVAALSRPGSLPLPRPLNSHVHPGRPPYSRPSSQSPTCLAPKASPALHCPPSLPSALWGAPGLTGEQGESQLPGPRRDRPGAGWPLRSGPSC